MVGEFWNQVLAGISSIVFIVTGWLGISPASSELESPEVVMVHVDEAGNVEGAVQVERQESPLLGSAESVDQDASLHRYAIPNVTSPLLAEKLEQLRASTWGDIKRPPPYTLCAETDGIQFNFYIADSSNDYEAIDIYVTDSDGGEAGHLLWSTEAGLVRYFESRSRTWHARQYGAVFLVSAREHSDSMVRLKNARDTSHFFSVSVGSPSGGCYFADNLLLGFPSNITAAYIPLTKSGDVGPISWDFDGDGVYDYFESLIYEPSEEQTVLLSEVWELLYVER